MRNACSRRDTAKKLAQSSRCKTAIGADIMNYSDFSHVRLSCVSSVVPKDEICLDDEVSYYNNDLRKVQRVKKMLGLDRRRIAPEGVTSSDLCIQAAQNVFHSMNCDPSSIDALVFVTQSPDYLAPATAFVQQAALGLPEHCAVFDVNLGCSGYIYGLWLASCMIESGMRKRVLLLCGDAGFRYMNPANRVTTPLFGDAGTASLLVHDENAPSLSFSLGNNGQGYEALIRPGGGGRIPYIPAQNADGYLDEIKDQNGTPWTVGGLGNTWMDGEAIFDFTMSVVPNHIRQHLLHKQLEPKDIDYLVLHQANRQIVENIAEGAGFTPEQTPWKTLSKYGNQSCASIPCAICDQLKSVCDTGNRFNLMLCGYGIGLSWGSCIGDFTGLHCCGMSEFVAPAHIPTREERIAYWHHKFSGDSDNE